MYCITVSLLGRGPRIGPPMPMTLDPAAFRQHGTSVFKPSARMVRVTTPPCPSPTRGEGTTRTRRAAIVDVSCAACSSALLARVLHDCKRYPILLQVPCGMCEASPPVPSPLVGEGQGGG